VALTTPDGRTRLAQKRWSAGPGANDPENLCNGRGLTCPWVKALICHPPAARFAPRHGFADPQRRTRWQLNAPALLALLDDTPLWLHEQGWASSDDSAFCALQGTVESLWTLADRRPYFSAHHRPKHRPYPDAANTAMRFGLWQQARGFLAGRLCDRYVVRAHAQMATQLQIPRSGLALDNPHRVNYTPDISTGAARILPMRADGTGREGAPNYGRLRLLLADQKAEPCDNRLAAAQLGAALALYGDRPAPTVCFTRCRHGDRGANSTLAESTNLAR